MSRLTFIVLCLLIPAASPAQGPIDGYLKGKGVLDIVPSFSFLSANTLLGAGQQTFNVPYKGNLLSVFAEYGISKKLDAVATIPYVFTSTQSGFQDGGIYLKYRPVYASLKNGSKLGILAGAGYSFPLSQYQPIAEGALGQRAQVLPLRAIFQWETPLGLFCNFTAGYHVRLDELSTADVALIRQQRPDYQAISPPDFSTLLFKIGFPAAHFYTDAWLERQVTRGGNNYTPGLADLPQAFGVDYTQIGGTLFYTENGKNGFILSGSYILNGRNVSKVLRITVGAVLKI
ncbi:MAG: hypothetical protein IPL65_19755 [Lewinellaceae bacterium]|nr:hypothetical protein [Lewinellaceae bacterium]